MTTMARVGCMVVLACVVGAVIAQLAARYNRTRGIVNFAGKLVRSADDITPRPAQDFKGAADCASGRPSLIVWSM